MEIDLAGGLKGVKALKELAKNIKKIGEDDPRRVIHSFKVGLALTLVSLMYYFRPLYDGFGGFGMWAVLTVVVIFEFSVGATICKGLNRGLATLLAAGLGVGVQHFATLFGEKGEPVVLAAVCTLMRFFPRIKARYDYGVMIFILTFSLVAVSGYRVEKIFALAHERFTTIVIGVVLCMLVSLLVFPVWAGEDLHRLIACHIENLACFLDGFGGEYFKLPEDESSAAGFKHYKPFLQCYKSILTSKNTEESLANFARWEPCHGRFRLCHPWKQYLKIGTLARQCAYHFEAISGYINSDIQFAPEFRTKIQVPCTKMSSESTKALRALASAMKTMTHPSRAADIHVQNSKDAVEELENILRDGLPCESNILTMVPDATVALTLTNIMDCVEKISEAVHALGKLAYFETVEPTVSPEKPALLLHQGTVKPVSDIQDIDHVIITLYESCIEDKIDCRNARVRSGSGSNSDVAPAGRSNPSGLNWIQ
ncbi:hypothetical protein Ancab_032306 [Ancistrocladus abbreviatus]